MRDFFEDKSKGEVLKELEKLDIKFKIPKTILINVYDWKKSKEKIFKSIKKNLKSIVAIRSSSKNEDKKFESNAGKYLSFLNIRLANKSKLFKCVDRIIDSYSRTKNISDQIIIQEMVENINSSGVIFTKDIETGAKYYVVNYDDVTGKTNTVTSGLGDYSNRILYIYKNNNHQIKSARFKKLTIFTKDLENKINSENLDLEFAIDNNLDIFLLQARPISTTNKWSKIRNSKIENKINIAENLIKKLFLPKKNIIGKTNIFGNMPDWNPVEIIGKYPSELSISLYKYLITDNTWAKARHIMGYKNMTKNKLMYIFCGQPYIDTRLSLNSFLPKNLKSNLSRKIIDHGLNLLRKYPFFHDKIEFEISVPSFNFSSEDKINILFHSILNKKEKKIFLNELKIHTKKIIEEKGRFSIDCCSNQVEKLNNEFEKLKKNNFTNIEILLKKCREVGTLNFSILARHGFIAKSFINSLIEKKIFTNNEIQLFEQNLNSITSNMLEDSFLVSKKKISKSNFMKKYGHLRPGTYDITSKRYDQMRNFKFNNQKIKKNKFKLKSSQKIKIKYLLQKNGFTICVDEFMNYLKQSLILREYSKFVFSKYLSLILEKIALIGKKKKISRSDLSHFNLNFFLKKKYTNFKKNDWEKIITQKTIEKKVFKNIKLPALIIDNSNIRVAPYQVNVPNFISSKKVNGNFINLDENKKFNKLKNKIIFIENADPGYDWIFAYKIKALVTKFGGINSHMAIRCSELSIPAVIGCGEQIYSELTVKKKNNIFIDCSASLIYSN